MEKRNEFPSPLTLKIALPSHMEQITRGPQKDYSQLTKVGRNFFMIKVFFGNIIMTLEVMCGRNTEPNMTSSWVLGQALAELWKS
jgi:hypothetical protein